MSSQQADGSQCSCCWICLSDEARSELFQPCACNSFVHRSCLHRWRYTGTHLRSYTHCPNCANAYRLAHVYVIDTPEYDKKHAETWAVYRQTIAIFWLKVALVLTLCLGVIATVTYLLDTRNKTVPVWISYGCASVLHGVPSEDDLKVWRDGFRSPQIRVWPYYCAFSVVITSCLVLAAIFYYDVDDSDPARVRSRRSRVQQYHNYHHHHPHHVCFCPDSCCHGDCCCDDSCCLRCTDDTICNNMNCLDCSELTRGGGGSNSNDVVGCIAVMFVVIALVVVVSAIWTLVLYTLRRTSNIQRAYADRLFAFSEERVGETRVLGRDENEVLAAGGRSRNWV
eukprot:PhM_4_TR5708/c0_g1_i1/m.94667